MEAANRNRAGQNQADVAAQPDGENDSFFQRRSVLLSVFVVGLILVVALPTMLLSVGFTDDCNSGITLIDNACLSAKRNNEGDKNKKDKINIRPKKQPFKIVERSGAGFGSLSDSNP